MTAACAFMLFETSFGVCALAWGPHGIVACQLPEADAAATQARLCRRHPEARMAEPTPAIRQAAESIIALLAGQARSLREIELDMAGVAAFPRSVYDAARCIPPGQTITYGELARSLGRPEASRAVGRALGMNPFAPIVPCHRITAADGRLGGFSAHGGASTKRRLLDIEGALRHHNLELFPAV